MAEEHTDQVLETLRAIAQAEFLAGVSADDIACALLDLGIEMSLREHGIAETAGLLRGIATAFEGARPQR